MEHGGRSGKCDVARGDAEALAPIGERAIHIGPLGTYPGAPRGRGPVPPPPQPQTLIMIKPGLLQTSLARPSGKPAFGDMKKSEE